MILPPNIEALVSAFLRDQPEMIDLVDDRGYTSIPKDAHYPLFRVSQLGDAPTGSPLHAIAFEVQVEAFGGSKSDAWRIAETARMLIDRRIVGVHPEGVVNGSTPGSLLDLPDETFQPAKPRYLFTSTIHARPVATVSDS